MRRRPRVGLASAGLATLTLALGAGTASADNFNPIRMTVSVPLVARLHRPLSVRVAVSADPGALDPRSGPIRAGVRLSSAECGGDFNHTTGVTLLDRALSPQPDPGEGYQGSARGSGRPRTFGLQTLCVYLHDDFQQFATETSLTVNVSRACTVAANRFDAAARSLAALRRRHRAGAKALARQRTATTTLRRRARAACGPAVTL